MKKITVYETFEENTRDLVDINIGDEILRNVPYFDREGKKITYDEAMELYGEEAFDTEIWEDENYLNFIVKWMEERE